MSAKTSTARREAFFRALAETGNQTIAAERARVSRSWVSLHRSGDPAFRERMEAALGQARDRLGTGGDGNRPPAGWGSLDGEELVVRGGNGRRVQIARARLGQWTSRVETRFLAALASTCNVTASCAEAGMTPAAAYLHRRRWPRFAKLWDEAVETGYLRIEMALVANAGSFLDPEELPPEAPLAEMSVAQAIHLLHMHKAKLNRGGGRPGTWKPPPSLNDPGIRESIMRKIEMVARMNGIDPAEMARVGRQYARRRNG